MEFQTHSSVKSTCKVSGKDTKPMPLYAISKIIPISQRLAVRLLSEIKNVSGLDLKINCFSRNPPLRKQEDDSLCRLDKFVVVWKDQWNASRSPDLIGTHSGPHHRIVGGYQKRHLSTSYGLCTVEVPLLFRPDLLLPVL